MLARNHSPVREHAHAIFNRAVKTRFLSAHQLTNIERPKVVTTKKPVISRTNRLRPSSVSDVAL